MPRLSFATILVDDMSKALPFYEDVLGFKVIKRDHYPDFVLLQQEHHPIALHQAPAKEPIQSRVILGIAVDDLPRWLEELEGKQVRLMHKTPQKFFGGHYAGLYDPAGNMLELIQWNAESWEAYRYK